MEIIRKQTEFHRENTVVSIGKYDGIHTGHRKLLEELKSAKKDGLEMVVFTFQPSFVTFFSGVKQDEIYSLEEKERYFEKLGIDVLIEFPLNEETVNISAESFIKDILVGNLGAKKIVAGTDVAFGKDAIGNAQMLKKAGEAYGFETVLIKKLCYQGREVSSSRIREEIRNGNMPLANRLLGDLYGIVGMVKAGKQIGRTIGFPTVNLLPEDGKLLPRLGVYFSEVEVRGKRHYGITNVGINPTVSTKNKVSIETYIFNFDEEIYGEQIIVYPVSFHRDEMVFDGLEELKAEIHKDRQAAEDYFKIQAR